MTQTGELLNGRHIAVLCSWACSYMMGVSRHSCKLQLSSLTLSSLECRGPVHATPIPVVQHGGLARASPVWHWGIRAQVSAHKPAHGLCAESHCAGSRPGVLPCGHSACMARVRGVQVSYQADCITWRDVRTTTDPWQMQKI